MDEQNDKKPVGRREFLRRAGKAGISIAAAGTVAYLLYDSQGPKPGVKAKRKLDKTRFRTYLPAVNGKSVSDSAHIINEKFHPQALVVFTYKSLSG